MEELALQIHDVAEPVFSVHDPGSEFVIVFVEVEAAGEPEPLEHEELRWAALAELLELPLAPSDRRFAEWIGQAASRPSPIIGPARR